MHSRLDRLLAQAQILAEPGVRFGGAVAGERSFQRLEELFLAGAGELLAQPGERLCQQGQGPAPLEERLRCGRVGRFVMVTALAVLEVERQQALTAAPL